MNCSFSTSILHTISVAQINNVIARSFSLHELYYIDEWIDIHRQTNRHTDRQTDRQIDKQTDRQTDRQIDKQTYR